MVHSLIKFVTLFLQTQTQTVKAWELTFWENVHPPPLVKCPVSCVTCHVSCITFYLYCFFLVKVVATYWRVCYQRGLPFLVSMIQPHLMGKVADFTNQRSNRKFPNKNCQHEQSQDKKKQWNKECKIKHHASQIIKL